MSPRVHLDLIDTADPTVLFEREPTSDSPRPCVITLDLASGSLSIYIDSDSLPAPVVRAGVLEVPLPHGCVPTPAGANTLLQRIAPDAQRVLDAATPPEPGDDPVTALTGRAAEIVDRVPQAGDISPEECVHLDVGQEPVTADTTDAEIDRRAAELADGRTGFDACQEYRWVAGGGEAVAVVLRGLREDARRAALFDL